VRNNRSVTNHCIIESWKGVNAIKPPNAACHRASAPLYLGLRERSSPSWLCHSGCEGPYGGQDQLRVGYATSLRWSSFAKHPSTGPMKLLDSCLPVPAQGGLEPRLKYHPFRKFSTPLAALHLL